MLWSFLLWLLTIFRDFTDPDWALGSFYFPGVCPVHSSTLRVSSWGVDVYLVASGVEECFSSVAFSSIVISRLLPESFTAIGIAYKLTLSTFLAI